MKKHILAVGDSFTYGEELTTTQDAYAQLIAHRCDATLINLAKPGSGNKRMIRNVMVHVATNQHPDLVIIGWSSCGRMEYADDDGVFDIWPGYGGRLFVKNQPWRLDLLDYMNKHHDSAYLYKMHLLDVIMLQSFLKQQNINYIMLNTCCNEYYHNIYYTQNEVLTPFIDATHYLGWPTEGMVEWTVGCKQGPNGHFLSEGHRKVADKLYEHIRNFGWLS